MLPVVEIVAMDAAVNRVGRMIFEPATFDVTPATIRHNLRGPWVVDDDPFEINQFGHPYQGAMYHGIARSNGLGYVPSMIYTFAGSAMWEIAGETTPPSFNDQVASGVAASFLGESLFRISRLALDRSDGQPGVWRKLGAVLASPPTGLNQLMVGTPAGLPSADAVPFSDIRVQVGGTAIAQRGTRANVSLDEFQPHFAFSIDYGYPGNAGYQHQRPFDYFRFESNVSSEGMEQLSTRGMIAGGDYGSGGLAGIWGLFGTYDYFTPDDFRLSTTAFSFGTTLQAGNSEGLVMQSTALLGAGYAAARALAQGNDDYHYGITPQSLVNLRLLAGRRAALDLTAREYFISGLGGFGTAQRDLIFVGDASLAMRVVGRHALALTYQRAGRSSEFFDAPDRSQARSRVGVFYTFLGSGGFGAVR
ncbi:MAG TPA: DUF3943 domain-containing protein [Vicinamibacterales bacterium]|nr:DUF3943 domain-containing protein [Vicinamibacterales bacterium]